MDTPPKYSKFGNALAIVTSLKPCCTIPILLSAFGAGTSWASSWAPVAGMILLPFLAWPAVLYSHVRLWKGLGWSMKHSAEAEWGKWLFQFSLTMIATVFFLYSLITLYIPRVFDGSASHHAATEDCCKPK